MKKIKENPLEKTKDERESCIPTMKRQEIRERL